jgi:O-acetyl-ADP-ribose deacetylase (regulator of RNase III)
MPQAVMQGVQVNKSTVGLSKGIITDLDTDAFVFYAKEDLALGSGFGSIISGQGGPSIEKELKELAPIAVGEAVVSTAGKLKAKHIIHAVGPAFQEEDTESKLRAAVSNSLKRADEKGIERLAFPAMGAGYHGIPLDLCARVMLETIQSHLKGETGIKEVVICVLDTPWVQSFQSRIAKLG